MMEHRYFVQWVTCESCKKSLRDTWLAIDGIQDVQFFSNKKVLITMDQHIDLSVLQDAITSLSRYSISDVSFSVFPSWILVYKPLFIVFAIIGLLTLLHVQLLSVSWWEVMMLFMWWWFIILSGLKLFNLPGFAEGYKSYDIVASRWWWYAWMYPFIELLLWILFLVWFLPLLASIVTLVAMIVSTIGVRKALGRKIQCVCIGTWFSLPLTKVTIVENLIMAAMALVMIFLQ